jgi:hypothetical protein
MDFHPHRAQHCEFLNDAPLGTQVLRIAKQLGRAEPDYHEALPCCPTQCSTDSADVRLDACGVAMAARRQHPPDKHFAKIQGGRQRHLANSFAVLAQLLHLTSAVGQQS